MQIWKLTIGTSAGWDVDIVFVHAATFAGAVKKADIIMAARHREVKVYGYQVIGLQLIGELDNTAVATTGKRRQR